MSLPEVSVLLPIYNGERYLREAIDSILNQTFTDFEFIIIDDGSTDATPEILESYSDPRIVWLRNETNLGVAVALNRGLAIANGNYVALMAADDISLLDRLSVQVTYLQRHPHVGVVGTQSTLINAQGQVIGQSNYPTNPVLIKWLLPLTPPFCIGAGMWRRHLIEQAGNYNESHWVAEDYSLLLRVSDLAELAQLSVTLYHYRIHGDGLTGQYFDQQERISAGLIRSRLRLLVDTPLSDELIFALRQLLGFYWPNTRPVSAFSIEVLLKLQSAFITEQRLSSSEIETLKQHTAQALINFALYDSGPVGQYALQQATQLKQEIRQNTTLFVSFTSERGHKEMMQTTFKNSQDWPRSILVITNYKGVFAGADRSLLNILDELPLSRQVYLVANTQTEDLLTHITTGLKVETLNVEFYTFPYTEIEWQKDAPTGQAFQEYLDSFLQVNFKALYILTQALKGVEIDLVYSNTSTVFLGALYASLYRKKHIWHTYETLAYSGEAQWFWVWLMQQYADVIVAPSQATADSGYGSHTQILSSGFNTAKFLDEYAQVTADDICHQLAIAQEDTVVLCLGTVSKTKGQQELVEAIRIIQTYSLIDTELPLRVLLVGYSATIFGKDLERQIQNDGLEQIVSITGHLSYGHVLGLLKRSQVVVQPSALADSYPNVIIEAMLAGKPVLASRIGGISEMIQDGETGLLCTPGNPQDLAQKLSMLLENPALGTRLGQNAARLALERFDIRRTLTDLTKLFREVQLMPPKSDEVTSWHAVLLQQMLHRETVIQMRDQELASVKEVLQARDEELASIKPVLQARDEELASIKPVLQARDEELASIKVMLQARNEELASMKENLQMLETQLQAIYDTKTWRILSKVGLA